MNRKQLSQFSVDELRMLRHRFLADTPTSVAHESRIHRTIKRINEEIYVKQQS